MILIISDCTYPGSIILHSAILSCTSDTQLIDVTVVDIPFREPIQITSLEMAGQELMLKEAECLMAFGCESKAGWYNPRVIGKPAVGMMAYKKVYQVRKQLNAPKFVWRVKKQSKPR